jgi:hypothetical protein
MRALAKRVARAIAPAYSRRASPQRLSFLCAPSHPSIRFRYGACDSENLRQRGIREQGRDPLLSFLLRYAMILNCQVIQETPAGGAGMRAGSPMAR